MLQFQNAASAYFLSKGANSVTVQAGQGANFPALGNGRCAHIKIEEPSTGAREFLLATDLVGDTFTTTTTAAGTYTAAAIVALVETADGWGAVLRQANRIINGCMRLWDYGTSSASPASGVWVANNWRVGYGGAVGTNTVARVAATPGELEYDNGPRYWLRWNQTVAPGTTALLRQPIEGVNTGAGGKVTVSFKAKAGSGTPSLQVKLVQKFGTGGAPSGDVDSGYIAFTLSTTAKRYQTTFTLPSISGKTLGSNGDDHLLLEFLMGSAATFDTYITDVQVERTPVASDFIPRPLALERLLAQRYFYKTFDDDTMPASNAGTSGAIAYTSVLAGANAYGVNVRFPVPMRASPTLTTYNTSAAGAAWRNTTAGADSGAASTAFASNRGVLLKNAQAGGDAAGQDMAIHLTAGAEIN